MVAFRYTCIIAVNTEESTAKKKESTGITALPCVATR